MELERKGEGRATIEPYHREWIRVRNQHIESIEVSLATPDGSLLLLSPGKNHHYPWFSTSIKETLYYGNITTTTNNMLGGSLTRYHTPTMHGSGFMQELVKLAGPSVVRSIGHGDKTNKEPSGVANDTSMLSMC